MVRSYPGGEPLVGFPPEHVTIQRILLRPNTLLEFMGGLFFVDALVERGGKVPELILPFAPGARQDRLNSAGDFLFTAKSISKEINARNFPKVTVLDPHSEVISALIDRCSIVHAHECFQCINPSYSAVASPVAGAEKRAGAVARQLKLPLLHGWKTRDVATGGITGFGLEPTDVKGCWLLTKRLFEVAHPRQKSLYGSPYTLYRIYPMKARIVYAAPEVNPGKVWKLEQLHLAYRSYAQDCINLLVEDKRGTINLSERRTYFPTSKILSSQILKNAQMHAVRVVETWIEGLYARRLKKVIRLREDLADHQRMELRCCGKYLVRRAGKFGKGTITQEMVDLYWEWVWDSEVSGLPPQVSEDFPMMLTEMTCSFGPSEDAKHFGWWLQASCLTRNRTVKIPLSFNPYLKRVEGLAKGVLARKREGRWTFQLCEKQEDPVFDGSQGKIAVDVGLNVIAATSDGRLYGTDFKPKFDKLYTKVRDLRANRQRQNFEEDSKRLARLEVKLSGKIKTEAGRISNKLVRDFPGRTFVVEDLDLSGCRGQKRFAYRALQTSLEHKAKTEKVNPAYSSRMCPSCGYVSRSNRKGVEFICRGCGRKSHADAIGGRNLLGRSEEKQITMKTPLHLVKGLLQRRFAERRRSPGVLLVNTELEPSSRRLTVTGSKDSRTASNQVLCS